MAEIVRPADILLTRWDRRIAKSMKIKGFAPNRPNLIISSTVERVWKGRMERPFYRGWAGDGGTARPRRGRLLGLDLQEPQRLDAEALDVDGAGGDAHLGRGDELAFPFAAAVEMDFDVAEGVIP